MERVNIFEGRHVMTILNVTPDSFYEGSRTPNDAEIEQRVRGAIEAGATIIDVGGYSSRPMADDISVEEEWRRVELGCRVVRRVSQSVVISVDTFRGEVARRAAEAFGEVVINDITAGEGDPDMVAVVAKYRLPYVAMHMRGTPQTMLQLTDYDDVVEDVVEYFRARVEHLRAEGVEKIILDPGFGFAKSVEQNYQLLGGLERLVDLGLPVLVGVSRKSMIYKVTGGDATTSLPGTIALGWEALRRGATILRVHDTAEAVESLQVFEKFDSVCQL